MAIPPGETPQDQRAVVRSRGDWRDRRTADSYGASFLLAAEAGLLEEDLAARLRPSAGLRNVLVHNYVDIDEAIVVRAVPLAIEQYGAYVKQAARWLAEHRGDGVGGA